MHPVMSEFDISNRMFEREQERQAIQHRALVNLVARQNGLPGTLRRLTRAVHQFLDPRGFALRQYRQAELARGTTTSTPTSPATKPSAPIRSLPAGALDDGGVAHRKAA